MADRPQQRPKFHPGAKAAVQGARKPSKRRNVPGLARPGSAGGATPPAESAGPQRLQKVLAAAGIGSRRQCEELILAGRVEIDRKVVMELGVRVEPAQQEIRLDGEVLARPRASQFRYYAANKPRGVVSTSRDPSGRALVVDLIPQERARLFAVGRLDLHSEGLILLTNDGELANRLTHPRYGIEKTYRVLVAGRPAPEVLDQLRRGVHLAEGVARADRVTVKGQHGKATWLEIVLSEGKNREIRRILARVGHKVLQLVRTAVGPVRLGKLRPGEHRRLTGGEVQALRNAIGRKG